MSHAFGLTQGSWESYKPYDAQSIKINEIISNGDKNYRISHHL